MADLKGKRILITRDSAQAGSLNEKLAGFGADVICVPTIDITDPPDWSSFDQAASRLLDFDWIVFSSVNAVFRTANRLSELGYRLTSNPDIRKAAIGNQTAQSAEKEGWEIDIVPDRFQAEDLLAALLKTDPGGKRIWVPRALEARPLLVEELSKAGAIVTETPVYQNRIPIENRTRLKRVLIEDCIDWVTFTSSSTVTNFFKILGEIPIQNKLPKLASIGRVTTTTIASHGLEPAFTADPQNLEGLCQGILEVEIRISNIK